MPTVRGIRRGRDRGIDRGISHGATWSKDASSNKGVPANSAEWDIFRGAVGGGSIAAPTGLWGMQDISGGAAAAIGAIPLVEEGARIDYQQAISGWTRKAITTRGDAIFTSSASLPDPATTSVMVLSYAVIEAAVSTSDRMYIGLTNIADFQTTPTPVIRVVNSGNILDGAATINGAVHPFVLKFDRAANTVSVYSDQEKISVAIAGNPNKIIAFSGSPTPGVTKFLYGGYWSGTGAEMSDATVKAMLQGLGWTVAW